ncbi:MULTISPECIES: type VI secretion system-associated FHA domain protein TagH [unclassified Caballeronia]|uniref:type VI secretion system-associated FHA domain protein TagH n=1 Tax=unclassified Caballeronia TaxID=2646786 RepID=UPI002029AECC|nr:MULTISPECIES: type VI secretion system-associated FHA domain protein TagH [unclassified Caballeronia]
MHITLAVRTYQGEPPHTPGTPLVCRFDAAGGTIGRGPGNTMVLPDAAKTVSRVQARIDWTGEGWRFVDLGSNPSRLNGRVLASGQTARLARGDCIEAGAYRLEVSSLDDDAQAFDAPLGVVDQAHVAGAGGRRVNGRGLEPAFALGARANDGVVAARKSAANGSIGDIAHEPGSAARSAFAKEPFVAPMSDSLAANARVATRTVDERVVPGTASDTQAAARAPLADDDNAPWHASGDDSRLRSGGAPAHAFAGSGIAESHAFSDDPLARAAVLFAAPLPTAHFDPLGGPLPDLCTPPRADGRAPFAGSASDHVPPEQFAYAPGPVPFAGLNGGIPLDYDPLDDVAFAAGASAAARAVERDAAATRPAGAENIDASPQTWAASSPLSTAAQSAATNALFDTAPSANAIATSHPRAQAIADAAVQSAAAERDDANPPADLTLAALLDGLNVDASVLRGRAAPEFARIAGSMLRTAIRGTVNVMLSRSVMKRGMGVDTTMLVPRGNNPLKFFPDGDSALAHMLRGAGAGYLAGDDALEGAFDDIRRHELAVLAGMRAAMQHLLRRFDPDVIAGEGASRGWLDWLPGRRKAQQWDRLVALHRELMRASADDLAALCGNAFYDAYERHADGSPERAPHASSHA